MKILLIYRFSNHRGLMDRLTQELRDRGLEVDNVCYIDFIYNNKCNPNWPFFTLCLIKLLYVVSKFSDRLSVYLSSIIRKFFLKNVISRYDMVDFHSFYPGINKRLVDYCIENSIPYDITMWGSDLLRSTESERQLMKKAFDHCRYLKMAENLKDFLIDNVGREYEYKIKTVYFGNSDFDVIDNISDENTQKISDRLFKESDSKYIVACGYNASTHQNHFDIIDAISKAIEIKDKIYLVFQMSYGGSKEYKEEVRTKLETLGIPFVLFESFMQTEEVAVLRRKADIVINLQDSDALAGSLQGHLYCGGVCLFANWLNYPIYDKNNVFYKKISRESLTNDLIDCVENYNKYKQQALDNHQIIGNLLSWKATSDNWYKIYTI